MLNNYLKKIYIISQMNKEQIKLLIRLIIEDRMFKDRIQDQLILTIASYVVIKIIGNFISDYFLGLDSVQIDFYQGKNKVNLRFLVIPGLKKVMIKRENNKEDREDKDVEMILLMMKEKK